MIGFYSKIWKPCKQQWLGSLSLADKLLKVHYTHEIPIPTAVQDL